MTLCISCPDGHQVEIAAEKLGQAVACPCCLSVFLAEADDPSWRFARKEEKKPRRSRDDDADDDDDDEEDEKPRKKSSKVKAGEPKKPAPKPAAKKPARKKDDDDDDDDDDEEAEDEEPEIEWTPRKRQLNLCGVGLLITIGVFAILILFTATLAAFLDWFTWGVMGLFQAQIAVDKISTGPAYAWVAAYIAGPFFTLAQIVLMVALFFNLSVPGKAEARSLAISGLVFGLLFFIFGTLTLLAEFQVVVSDQIRAERMEALMGGGAGLCFIVSLMSAMAFQSKLMIFMNMKLEASQAVTNVGFYFLFLAMTMAALYASVIICNYLHYFLGYAVILGILIGAGFAGRPLYAQINLILKLHKTIQTYIREAV